MNEYGSSLPSPRFDLMEIVDATNGRLHLDPDLIRAIGEFGMRTHGVSTDTRNITCGSLFVALRGANFDGHDFIEQAREAEAVLAVVERLTSAKESYTQVVVPNTLHALGDLARYHRNRFDIPVIGITGSYGKTTTRAFLQAALSPSGNILASRENFNNEIGVPQTLFGLNKSHKAAIVEMGMRGSGQIEYLAKIARPTIGVITNIGPQHIELLGSLENVARAKAELIEQLPQDGVAILPSEGDYSELLLQTAQEIGCRIVTFGTNENADFRVISTRSVNESVEVEFQLKTQNSKLKTLLPLPGVHNATNAAAALAVAHELGVDLKKAARALAKVDVPGARMRLRRANEITVLDDCYNAGPNSMRAALETLRDWQNTKRRIAVLGTMKELGDFSEEEHRKLVETANDCCDFVIGVGEEMSAALRSAKVENITCADAHEAAQRVLDVVQYGDVVLVKGSRSVGLEIVVQKLVGA